MPLSKDDLVAIGKIVESHLKPIKDDLKSVKNDVEELKTDLKLAKNDIKGMKADIKLLATLNQLEEIRKDKRLRALYMQMQE